MRATLWQVEITVLILYAIACGKSSGFNEGNK